MGATTYTQEDTRARNDDGTISTATYMGSGNNENQSIDIDTIFRWRMVIQVGGMDAGDRNFTLFAQKNGAGGYAQILSSSTGGLRLINDANSIADDSVTVQGIGDGTYTSGTSNGYCDGTTDDDTGVVNIAAGEEGEVEFCLQMPDGEAADTDYWDLRVYRGTTAFDTYTNTPRVTAVATGFTLTADQGSLTLSGLAAGLEADRQLVAAQGSISITGLAANLDHGYYVSAEQGSLSLTGLAADLIFAGVEDDMLPWDFKKRRFDALLVR